MPGEGGGPCCHRLVARKGKVEACTAINRVPAPAVLVGFGNAVPKAGAHDLSPLPSFMRTHACAHLYTNRTHTSMSMRAHLDLFAARGRAGLLCLHMQMSAARDVLVLLGVLAQLGAAGTTPLTTQQLAELQGGVYGEVAVLLQRATLVFWLCSTHATTGVCVCVCAPRSWPCSVSCKPETCKPELRQTLTRVEPHTCRAPMRPQLSRTPNPHACHTPICSLSSLVPSTDM